MAEREGRCADFRAALGGGPDARLAVEVDGRDDVLFDRNDGLGSLARRGAEHDLVLKIVRGDRQVVLDGDRTFFSRSRVGFGFFDRDRREHADVDFCLRLADQLACERNRPAADLELGRCLLVRPIDVDDVGHEARKVGFERSERLFGLRARDEHGRVLAARPEVPEQRLAKAEREPLVVAWVEPVERRIGVDRLVVPGQVHLAAASKQLGKRCLRTDRPFVEDRARARRERACRRRADLAARHVRTEARIERLGRTEEFPCVAIRNLALRTDARIVRDREAHGFGKAESSRRSRRSADFSEHALDDARSRGVGSRLTGGRMVNFGRGAGQCIGCRPRPHEPGRRNRNRRGTRCFFLFALAGCGVVRAIRMWVGARLCGGEHDCCDQHELRQASHEPRQASRAPVAGAKH